MDIWIIFRSNIYSFLLLWLLLFFHFSLAFSLYLPLCASSSSGYSFGKPARKNMFLSFRHYLSLAVSISSLRFCSKASTLSHSCSCFLLADSFGHYHFSFGISLLFSRNMGKFSFLLGLSRSDTFNLFIPTQRNCWNDALGFLFVLFLRHAVQHTFNSCYRSSCSFLIGFFLPHHLLYWTFLPLFLIALLDKELFKNSMGSKIHMALLNKY